MRLGERDVTLCDGAVVSNYSQEWLLETRDREIEARGIARMADAELGIRLAVSRLGGGAECERRLRACLAAFIARGLDAEADRILRLVYREDRQEALAAYSRRFGPAAGDDLRARVLAIWEERRAAAAA